jgi:hypothetical protein
VLRTKVRISAFFIYLHTAGVLVAWGWDGMGWDEPQKERVVSGLCLFHDTHLSVVYSFIDTERKYKFETSKITSGNGNTCCILYASAN